MTDREVIKSMAFEYFATYHTNELLEAAPQFYDYLLQRGFNRQKLSRMGIGRDIEAGDAQQWRGDELE